MDKVNSDVIPCRRHRDAGVFMIRIWGFWDRQVHNLWFCRQCGTRCVEMGRHASARR